MVTAARHYEELLAGHYTWMFGGFDEQAAGQQALLEALGLHPRAGKRALDLGCGSGFQSAALARMGYSVTAVDLCERLLAELRERVGSDRVETARNDMVEAAGEGGPFEVVVCMGDTLNHLESVERVGTMLDRAAGSLEPGGNLVLSFRDLTIASEGTDRFILVRSTDDLIMTCALEYEPEHVVVTDLFHVRDGSDWRLDKSSYRKLRIAPTTVAEMMERAGLRTSSHPGKRGLVTLVGRRS